MQKNFNTLNWLNQFLDNAETLSPENLQEVLLFTLMWNMFESITCQRRFSISTIESKINALCGKNALKYESFEPILHYFKARYIENGVFNSKFDALQFRRKDRRPIVESVLRGELKDINNMVLAIIIIVYRIRNNLFHGEKSIVTLDIQMENFVTANQAIAHFLEAMKASYYIPKL